jgi:hypothetical protein
VPLVHWLTSFFSGSCSRWSALPVMVDPRRQAEPRIHRLLPDRVAGRRKGRCVKRAHRDSADRRVAAPFPIERGAAIRAEMKSNAIAAVGVAFVDLSLAIEPHPIFQIRRAEMEGGAGAALSRLAVARQPRSRGRGTTRTLGPLWAVKSPLDPRISTLGRISGILAAGPR